MSKMKARLHRPDGAYTEVEVPDIPNTPRIVSRNGVLYALRHEGFVSSAGYPAENWIDYQQAEPVSPFDVFQLPAE